MANKPTVFNYREYEDLRAAYKKLLEEVECLRKDKANLEIKLRIAEDQIRNGLQ